MTPLKAIRAKCLDCSGGSYTEVRFCPVKECVLWQWRFGSYPKTVLRKEGTLDGSKQGQLSAKL